MPLIRYGIGNDVRRRSKVAAARKTPYVSVNLTEPARDALQLATLRLAADVGRRLTLSTTLIAALRVATDNPDAFKQAVTSIGETK